MQVYISFACFWHFQHALLLEALLPASFVLQCSVFIDFACSLGLCQALHRVYIWPSLSSSILLSGWRTCFLMKWFYTFKHSHYTEGSRRPSPAPPKFALLLCCHGVGMAAWLQPVRRSRPMPVLQRGSAGAQRALVLTLSLLSCSWRRLPVSHHQLHQQLHGSLQTIPHLCPLHGLSVRAVAILPAWHVALGEDAQGHRYCEQDGEHDGGGHSGQ